MFNYREDVVYPSQCCKECALKHGGELFDNHISSVWIGQCDVCHKDDQNVTSPRDYGYPSFPMVTKNAASKSIRSINDLRQDISEFVKRSRVDI